MRRLEFVLKGLHLALHLMLFLHVLLSVPKDPLLVLLLDAVKDLLDGGMLLAHDFLVQKRLVKLCLQLCKLLSLHSLHF